MLTARGPIAKPLARQPIIACAAFPLHAGKSTKEAGRAGDCRAGARAPGEAAEQDPVGIVAPRAIAREWKRFYKQLLEIRDGIIDQETRLQNETAQNQPQFMTDPGAETANAAFAQDKALGRASTYQEMLDEVNGALRRSRPARIACAS